MRLAQKRAEGKGKRDRKANGRKRFKGATTAEYMGPTDEETAYMQQCRKKGEVPRLGEGRRW
jgi:hypothetical protein